MRYTDPDGRSVKGKLISGMCFLGASVVFCAGTAVILSTGGTTAFIIAPKVIEISVGLALLGVAINAADNYAENSVSHSENRALVTMPSPSPIPPNNDHEDKQNKKNNSSQSAKDAKKLDNKGADDLAKEKGYKNAHELKKDYVKTLKDKKIDHYNIYKNTKTGEAFMIHNEFSLVIPLE